MSRRKSQQNKNEFCIDPLVIEQGKGEQTIEKQEGREELKNRGSGREKQVVTERRKEAEKDWHSVQETWE